MRTSGFIQPVPTWPHGPRYIRPRDIKSIYCYISALYVLPTFCVTFYLDTETQPRCLRYCKQIPKYKLNRNYSLPTSRLMSNSSWVPLCCGTRLWLLFPWLLAFACGVRAQTGLTATQIEDFTVLSQGLTTLAAGSIYISRLHLYGTAIAVAVANDGGPMVAANRYGSGRLIHFGHESMISSCCSGTGIGGLVSNAAQWAAGAKTTGIRVGHYGMSAVVDSLVAKVSFAGILAASTASILAPLLHSGHDPYLA